MARRGVDAAGARLQGDVLAEEDHRVPVVEGMPAVLLLQDAGLEGGDDLRPQARRLAEGISFSPSATIRTSLPVSRAT